MTNTDIRVSGLSSLTTDAINACALISIHKHGIERTPANPSMTNGERLAILAEAIGEVARAMTYDVQDPTKLERELLQVAAMAGMWVDGITAIPTAPTRQETR